MNEMCSFCGKSRGQVQIMVSSPRDHSVICDECIVESLRIAAHAPRQLSLRVAFSMFQAVAKLGYRIARLFCEGHVAPSRSDPMARQGKDIGLPSIATQTQAVCSFCGNSQAKVKTMTGPGRGGAFICDKCAVSALATMCRRTDDQQANVRAAFFVFSAVITIAHNAVRLFHYITPRSELAGRVR
jgi:hypothetical protein